MIKIVPIEKAAAERNLSRKLNSIHFDMVACYEKIFFLKRTKAAF